MTETPESETTVKGGLPCTGISTVVFSCISLMSNDVKHFLFTGWLLTCLVWWNVQIFFPFLIGLFAFLLLNYKTSLYILDRSCFFFFFFNSHHCRTFSTTVAWFLSSYGVLGEAEGFIFHKVLFVNFFIYSTCSLWPLWYIFALYGTVDFIYFFAAMCFGSFTV